MSPKPDNLQRAYTEQLSEFDKTLRNRVDPNATLTDLNTAIKQLIVVNRDCEADIRAILHKRLQDGHIHDETFRLVLGMLDSVVSDDTPTIPEVIPLHPSTPEPFGSTTIVPSPTTPNELVDGHVQIGTLLRDRFQLEERVAAGGMGVVYKALDHRLAEAGGLEPWVAIKVLNPKLSLNPDAVRALQQEGAKGRCLSHPNIVRFIDIDRHEDLYFVVMEWLEGKSLASILNAGKGKEIDRQMTMDIVTQVAEALDYAHRCGVVHADVKPSNIMITPEGTVKLIDFGIARVRQQQIAGDTSFDPSALFPATPAYSSMQVLTGETPVPADDVFSLGCLMYRLVAGYRVFGPRNAAEAAQNGMSPQRPQRLGDAEWRALKKSLAYARVSRFSSARDFLEALTPARKIAISVDDTLRNVPALPETRSRKPVLSILLLAVLGIAAVKTDFGDRLPGMVDELKLILAAATNPDDPLPDVPEGVVAEPVEVGPAAETATVSQATEEPETESESPVLESGPAQAVAAETSPVDIEDAESVNEMVAPEPIDFSQLPPATLIIPLAHTGELPPQVELALVENGKPAIVDLVRQTDVGLPLSVNISEVGFTGNRSPWQGGQYSIENSGDVHFEAGQPRARTVITMAPDPLREADQTATLLLRDADNAGTELATINLRLEDDDQRIFESSLPVNTVAFAVSRVSVRESDPAAQIDVIRFKPGDRRLELGYQIRGVTATEGEDFFEPRSTVVTFAAGQRSARILIPLVQDVRPEDDEAFILELITDSSLTDSNLFRRIAVMIRDDDGQ